MYASVYICGALIICTHIFGTGERGRLAEFHGVPPVQGLRPADRVVLGGGPRA